MITLIYRLTISNLNHGGNIGDRTLFLSLGEGITKSSFILRFYTLNENLSIKSNDFGFDSM
jgi:hypothetical protein